MNSVFKMIVLFKRRRTRLCLGSVFKLLIVRVKEKLDSRCDRKKQLLWRGFRGHVRTRDWKKKKNMQVKGWRLA